MHEYAQNARLEKPSTRTFPKHLVNGKVHSLVTYFSTPRGRPPPVPPHLFILDDDQAFAGSVSELARLHGFQPHVAYTVRDARMLLMQRPMDLLLMDLQLPDGSGLDLLEDIDLAEHGRIAIVTGNPTIESAIRAVSGPVLDYLVKPLDHAQLEELLQKTANCARQLPPAGGDAEMIGRSQAIRAVVEVLQRVARSDASLLITGESGTGKELAARVVHDHSGVDGAFVAINCGAVAPELLASQLFGHERGSFTGAHTRHIGVFERASHGTLLLDEISEMPPSLQVYLLRVLETGSVTRVGGNETIPTPTRVIAATNRDPLEAMRTGQLREDLYYRLADIPVHLPPLRERGDDVVILARAFIDRLNARYNRRKYLAPGMEQHLVRHPWPGNVRELRSAVQRAYLLEASDAVSVRPVAPARTQVLETEHSILFSVGTTMAEMERRVLLKTLAHCNNDKTATARTLGISVRTVHNHLARIVDESGESTGGPRLESVA